VPPAFVSGPAVLADAPAMRYLFKDTELVAMAPSPRTLAAKPALTNLARLAPRLSAKLAGEVMLGAGVDLFDPAALERAGIDLDRPIGVALLQRRSNTYAIFATLTDDKRLTGVLEATSNKLGDELDVSRAGDGLIFQPRASARLAVVLRGGLVFAVVTDGAASVRDLAAVRIASIEPRDSLAANPVFRRAATRLDFGRDVAGYLSLRFLGAENLEQARGWEQDLALEVDTIEASLEHARRTGVAPRDLERFEARRKEKKRILAMTRQAVKSRVTYVDGILGALGGIGFGLELDGALVRAKIRGTLGRGTLPAGLMRPASRPSQLVRATRAKPTLLLSLHARPAQLMELIDMWFGMSGSSLGPLKQAFAAHTKLDFERDFVALLSGEAGVATTEENGVAGLNIVLGVTDAGRARKLLTAVVSHPALAPFVKEGKDTPRLTIPYSGQRPIHVGVAGDALVASTDPAFFERMNARGDKESFARKASNPDFGKLLSLPVATVLVLDGSLFRGWFQRGESRNKAKARRIPPPSNAPESAELREMSARVARLRAEIAMIERRRDKRADKHVAESARHLGTAALLVSPDGKSNLVGFGGLFVADASVEQALAQIVRLGLSFAAEDQKTARSLQLLRADHDRYYDELVQIRLRDIAEWEKTRAGKTPSSRHKR
jgi:hypothetical protein